MVYIQASGLQLPISATRPAHTIYFAGPKQLMHVVVDDADTKSGDIVKMKVTTYPNGVEDDAAESVSAIGVMEIKALATAAGSTAYNYNVTYSSGEEADMLLLIPGLIHWARCADNTGAIAIGDTLETDAGGRLTLAHASTATTAGHKAHWMSLQTRAQSATESWILVLYLGRGFAIAA